jgi:sn-glycerol 3-phosphate transport system substrate-binding protein
MLTPPGIIKPLATLLEEEGIRLPEEDFFAAVRAFYSVDGKLQALPFTISIPVIFYNASLLKKWGIDAENFPRSEETLEKLFENIKAAGFDCAYTSAYPSWVHIESYSAMHGLFSTSEAIFKHIIKLKEWQQQGYLQYAGRRNEATSLFTSGHCPLFSQSLGAYRSLQLTVPFEVGVALFPLDEAISQKRYNLVPGGAALWVVQGHPKEVYRGIALFFQFLATPVVQAYWFSHTGYLPLGVEGGYRSLQNGKGAALLLLASQALAYAKENRGPYSGPQQQIRTLYDEALEMIFSGMVSSQKAWDEANLRASYVLMRFFRNRQG